MAVRYFDDDGITMLKTLTTTLTDKINDRLGAMFGFEGDLSLERLLWQTGKSREELLEIILADDEIDACRQDIESALKAKPYRIWGDELAEDDVNRLLGAIRPHLQTLIATAVMARFNGFAIIEYVYKQDDKGFWVIDKMLPKDGETHRFTLNRQGELLFNDGIKQTIIDTQIKCLALTSRATPTRPMGEMMVIKAYPAVMLRNKGFAYAGQFITRYAQPFIIGKQGHIGAGSFVKAIFNLSGGGAAAIGTDESIEIKQLTATGDAFTTIERLCNARIQKLLLGRVKISELTVGSRAATETDDKARMDRMSGYAELLAIAIQHAIDAIIAVNNAYGTPIHAPNGAIFEFAEPLAVDLNRASRDKTYADMGLVFTADYYKDMLGLEEHHFTQTPQAQAHQADNPQTNADTKLSQSQSELMLSTDTPSTPSQTLIKDTLTPVFELSDSEDYNDFQNKLAALSAFDLDNEEFITDLAQQSADEYTKGLNADLTHDHDHTDHDKADTNGN